MKEAIQGHAIDEVKDPAVGKTWEKALIFSATIGFAADLIGISLCAASYPAILPGSDILNVTGTWLIAGGLPFIFFAAHCLDKIDSIRDHNATV
ncbi:MAG TPA: hypothetical protein VMM38_00815 [Aridibacter sp.]|nr:hypothetical protein [Aridibacter sp.]